MIYDKGKSDPVSSRFQSTDFDCKCKYPTCTTTDIDPRLVDALEKLLDLVDDFKITSAYRCVRHNKEVGGEKDSQHLIGKAVDIESPRYTGPELSRFVLQVDSFERGGLGVADHWLHCDTRLVRARWTYPISH